MSEEVKVYEPIAGTERTYDASDTVKLHVVLQLISLDPTIEYSEEDKLNLIKQGLQLLKADIDNMIAEIDNALSSTETSS